MINSREFYNYIGNAIREHREQAGLTQEELADRIGMRRSSITSIEMGRQNVLVHSLYSIAEAFNVPINNLLPAATNGASTKCQVCGFDVNAVYGDLVEQLAADKFLRRLKPDEGSDEKQISEGAFICENCNKFLKRYPEVSLKRLRKHLEKDRLKSETKTWHLRQEV